MIWEPEDIKDGLHVRFRGDTWRINKIDGKYKRSLVGTTSFYFEGDSKGINCWKMANSLNAEGATLTFPAMKDMTLEELAIHADDLSDQLTETRGLITEQDTNHHLAFGWNEGFDGIYVQVQACFGSNISVMLMNENDESIEDEHDCIPDWFPGTGARERRTDISFDIRLRDGKILNWKTPDAGALDATWPVDCRDLV